MPGKTRIDGTAYNIKGGKTRIDGTVYTIKQGKTRVNGTAYTITLSSGTQVIIEGDLNSTYAYATVNGTKITATGTTKTLESGGTLSVYVSSNSTSYRASCRVYLNDSAVKSGYGTYTLTNPSQYKTITLKFVWNMAGSYAYYHCRITTT